MKSIGIDFGTTNSIISFINTESNIVTFEKSAGATGYIPSFLSIDEDDMFEYGRNARVNQSDNECCTFSQFKMHLGKETLLKPSIKSSLNHEITPYNATKKYLECMINDYIECKGLSDLSDVVITVPDQWIRSGQHKAREDLIKICEDLKLPLHSLISEPVAATAYYLYMDAKLNRAKFSGHVLTCDYGGGTLDLSLIHVNNNGDICVLHGEGLGTSQSLPFGAAGVGYDKEVLKLLYGENSVDDELLYIQYERRKIDCTSKITKLLKTYIEDEKPQKIFKLNDITLTSKVLIDAYKTLIEAPFIEQLYNMSDFMVNKNIDIDNADNFRILFAGGFSNFFLVQKTIKDLFKIEDEDKRVSAVLDDTDKAFSISKGAALIANNLVTINNKCPITLGIKGIDKSSRKDIYVPIIEHGVSVQEYEVNPRYHKSKFIAETRETLVNTSIEFYSETPSGEIIVYQLTDSMAQYLPNPHPDNKWEVGFSVDRNLIFTIHIRDVENEDVNKVSLGNISKNENLTSDVKQVL